jgi:dynein heavy chain
MENNKKDFNTQINDLEKKTTEFKAFSDIDNFEEIASQAKQLKVALDEANEYAKMINNREQLVGYEEIADFTSLPAMIKEFKPYFDLWTTVEEWKKSYNSWLNDPFDEVDAGKVEETVDNSIKTLSGVIRFFKSKELSQITKIAETLKADVDLFKP